jgi:hypothetical protein
VRVANAALSGVRRHSDSASDRRTIPAIRHEAPQAWRWREPCSERRAMKNLLGSESSLCRAFDSLLEQMVALERAWTSELERSGLRHTTGDIIHHVCAAIADLDDVWQPDAPPSSIFNQIDSELRVLAHEAYLAVLALGQMLTREDEPCPAEPKAVEAARAAVLDMLDELAPFVSRADDSLRRVLLDGEPLEAALERIANAR